ncbi:FIG00388320: hypothetical protein [hydrothermal vent metagenome]|uniref:Nitrous oxide reductase maturation protein, outer-membrane lipoprotein NosL n=1 Tax=hydrothermal vent metagenome TaxID=652676 RepID=A0A3B1DSB7_9ZZZZ
MIVVKTGNIAKRPIKIVLGKFQDSDCAMVINDTTYTSEVISPNGKTWFFHDHGGLVHWIENKKFKDDAIIWVMSKDTKRWIDGYKAWYSRTDITPMFYGFGAYENKKDDYITYKQMRLFMLRGETMANPSVKKQLLQRKVK